MANMSKPRPTEVLLAVFDQAALGDLCAYLGRKGIAFQQADTPEQAMAMLRETPPPRLLLAELSSRGLKLDQLRQLPATVLTVALAVPDPHTYFAAAKAGVAAILPLPLGDFAPILGPLLQRAASPERPPRTGQPVPFASEEMAEVRALIEKVAPTSATVLIRGESGVGKELAARLIHTSSLRGDRPFIKVNCAAIPNELLESELFGYEAGAFTGAVKAKPGKFELADGGTIFLDEIGELHPVLQAKLLHVLQDGEFARLGAKHDTSVDVRVICATNKLLEVLVGSGQFREDLYYRINVVTVSLPPLRSRVKEIPGLVRTFLERYSALYGKPLVPLPEEAMWVLMTYHWPGNIRELENLCKRYVIVGGIEQILRELEQRKEQQLERRAPILLERAERETPTATEADLASAERPPTLLEIGRRAAWAAEMAAIEETLQATRWNRREAARRLGVSYKALLNKIAQMRSGEIGEEEESRLPKVVS